MSAGKLASQAGHAYLGAFLQTLELDPPAAKLYAAEQPGTKVCLQASLKDLMKAELRCREAGVPCFLVVDQGCPDFFGGEPTVTALGFGPARQDQVAQITKPLRLL